MIGQTLAHFCIVAKLGEGGMGVVYRATDEKLRRDVALKVLPESLAADPERRRRFLREARAAAAVTHGTIATVYEVDEADGHIFIAMELVRGETLRERMAPGLIHAEAMRIAKEIAKGLAHAHESGVVHRDLKPENVMIAKDGAVKILDFGLAKLMDVNAAATTETGPTASHVTAEGHVMGTPPYMSPEQANGKSDVDARSDVFSFGTILYEMLSGQRPFRGETAIAVLYSVLHADPEPLDAACPDAPAAAVVVVARCLRKAREERFTSGRELSRALEEPGPPVIEMPSGKALPAARVSTATGMGTALGATVPADADRSTAASGSGRDDRGSSSRQGPRRAWFATTSVLVLAAALAWWRIAAETKTRKAAAAPASSVTQPSAPTARAPVSCRDVSIPESKSAEAVAAYRAGTQAWCDANQSLAQNNFQRAVDLDPTLASPHLRLSRELFDDGDTEAARRELEIAQQLRVSLSPRDLELLSFYEPTVMRSPPDWAESLRRRDAAVQRSPEVAELWALRAEAHVHQEKYDRARADATRAAELDPTSAVPWAILAEAERDDGRLDAERAALDRCLEVASNAGRCLEMRALLRSRQGDCDGFSADGDALVAASPNDWRGYYIVTSALALRNVAAETLHEAKARDVARVPARAGWREMARLHADTQIALWVGDFATAEEGSRARLRVHDSSNSLLFFSAGRDLVRVLVESGRVRDAGMEANALLKQSELWALPNDIFADPTPSLLDAARRAGVLKPAEWSSRRDAWIAKWTKLSASKSAARDVVVAAYVWPAETREDAEEAVRRLPELVPLSSTWARSGDFLLGKAYFLAGRIDDAVPYLQRAAASCEAFERPFPTIRAALMLGQALEQQHDAARACDAYGRVTARWGHAKPRSVSAEAARDGMKRLACAG